jgi:hypothetical protein
MTAITKEKFILPPLTLSWQEIQSAWNALGNPWSPLDPKADHASNLEEQFFAERLVYNPDLDVLHLRFSYDYEIDTQRIKNPMHLLRWISHLSEKTWMNTTFLDAVIKKVCTIKKWNLYQ